MKKYHSFLLFFVILIFLTSCDTLKPQKQGVISIKNADGSSSSVVQPSNSETPAVLSSENTSFTIIYADDRMISTNSNTGETVYNVGKGDSVVSSISSIDANTGNQREDPAFRINAVMENTKYIQYTGIGLIVLGVALVVIFKVPIQALFLSALGVGMIILQSTLSNPAWSWIMIAGVIVLPAFWLYHTYVYKSTNKVIVSAIDELEKEDPITANKVKSKLSKKMDNKHKNVVKQLKK